MPFETIMLECSDRLAVLTLDRPEALNAINARMKEEIAEAVSQIEDDEACRAMIVTGAGDRAFCAGADIKERSSSDPTAQEFVARQRRTVALFSRIAELRIPTIAALNGIALGGGAEIALACDFRIAADSSRFGLTEINLGVIPAGGGTQRLARLVGTARAKRLVLTGEIADSARALQLGIVDEVAPDEELMARAMAFAGLLADKAPMAVAIGKSVIDKGAGGPISAGFELELQGAAILFASEDRKEGMRAFLEKRPAQFSGR